METEAEVPALMDSPQPSEAKRAVRSSSRKVAPKSFYSPAMYELDATIFNAQERRKFIGMQGLNDSMGPATLQRDKSQSPNRSPVRQAPALVPKSSSRTGSTSNRRKSRPYSRKSSMASLTPALAESPEPEELPVVVEKPVEERSFQELFPDLDTASAIMVIRMHPNFGLILPKPPETNLADVEMAEADITASKATNGTTGEQVLIERPPRNVEASHMVLDALADLPNCHHSVDEHNVHPSSDDMTAPGPMDGAPLPTFNLSPEASESELPPPPSKPAVDGLRKPNLDTIEQTALIPSPRSETDDGEDAAKQISNGWITEPPPVSAAWTNESIGNGALQTLQNNDPDGMASFSSLVEAATSVSVSMNLSIDSVLSKNDGTLDASSKIIAVSQSDLVLESIDEATNQNQLPLSVNMAQDPFTDQSNATLVNESAPLIHAEESAESSSKVTSGKPTMSDPTDNSWALSLFQEDEEPVGGQLLSKIRNHSLGVELQTEFPSFYIPFQKPVPKAVYEEIEPIEAPQADDQLPGYKRPEFVLPESHYVRYVEPAENELSERIEYDMDEQDLAWLNLINEERKQASEPGVPELVFELIMDRLEKEWFDATKDLPKPVREENSAEDTACAVCDDGGAFKQTNTSRWAHVMCAQWIPEAHFANPVYMEPIESVEAVPESRWRLQCYICKRRKGACIQCSSKSCYVAYHVTCARKVKLYMKMRVHSGAEEVTMRSFCDRHCPKEHRDKYDIEKDILTFRQSIENSKSKALDHRSDDEDHDDGFAGEKRRSKKIGKRSFTSRRIVDSDDDESPQTIPASRSARAHQSHYAPQAPIMDYAVVKKIANSIKALIRKKLVFVEQVCRYWSLKRESRRGAPLLKRLHLEPWTATASATKEDETFRAKRNEILRYVRYDLERVRILAEMVKKREKEKLKQYQLQTQYLEMVYNPVTQVLRPILDDIRRLDPKGLFAEPVNTEDVPDYLDIIKNPMDFQTMKKKLESHVYRDLKSFKIDLHLICDNASLYNTPDTAWGRAAPRLKERMTKFIEKAEALLNGLPLAEGGYLKIRPPESLFLAEIPSSEEGEEDDEEKEQVVESEANGVIPSESEPVLIVEEKDEAGNKENRVGRKRGSADSGKAINALDSSSNEPLPPEVLAPPGDEELAMQLQQNEVPRTRSLRSRVVETGENIVLSPKSSKLKRLDNMKGQLGVESPRLNVSEPRRKKTGNSGKIMMPLKKEMKSKDSALISDRLRRSLRSAKTDGDISADNTLSVADEGPSSRRMSGRLLRRGSLSSGRIDAELADTSEVDKNASSRRTRSHSVPPETHLSLGDPVMSRKRTYSQASLDGILLDTRLQPVQTNAESSRKRKASHSPEKSVSLNHEILDRSGRRSRRHSTQPLDPIEDLSPRKRTRASLSPEKSVLPPPIDTGVQISELPATRRRGRKGNVDLPATVKPANEARRKSTRQKQEMASDVSPKEVDESEALQIAADALLSLTPSPHASFLPPPPKSSPKKEKRGKGMVRPSKGSISAPNTPIVLHPKPAPKASTPTPRRPQPPAIPNSERRASRRLAAGRVLKPFDLSKVPVMHFDDSAYLLEILQEDPRQPRLENDDATT
ncbi:nuA3 HAT complex component nto1 [Phlyctochytrium planicorne]|nr:nuA3 HAT complex component nto1 [Phlyctochytrium planicorne]